MYYKLSEFCWGMVWHPVMALDGGEHQQPGCFLRGLSGNAYGAT